jgi:hypothetical protein
MSTYVVEVNEAGIWASQRGSTWWNEWRLRMEPTGRITVITPSLGGDRVHIACDSKDDAQWLAGHMHEFAGIPKAAVKVTRLAAARQ